MAVKKTLKKKTVKKKTPAKKKRVKTTAKKAPVKKATPKKKAPKKTSVKKTVKKKTAKKKTAVKKIKAKKTTVKKAAVKKAAAKKTARKKTASKKTAAKAAVPKKVTQKKTTTKKSAPKKIAQKKTTIKKAPLPSPYKKNAGIKPKYFFNAELPKQYQKTFLRAIPRDPAWIFLYWEITDETLDRVKKSLGSESFATAKWILRVIDITGIDYTGSNALSVFDIEINSYTNNWYIQVPESERTYIVEHGLLTREGAFFMLIRSNPVQVPSDTVSSTIDENWHAPYSEELIRHTTQSARTSPGSSENVIQSSLFSGASERNVPDTR